MKYLGIQYGKLVEGLAILPSIDISWMSTYDETFMLSGNTKKKSYKNKIKKYYNVRFAFLLWYFTIGCIHKRAKAFF